MNPPQKSLRSGKRSIFLRGFAVVLLAAFSIQEVALAAPLAAPQSLLGPAIPRVAFRLPESVATIIDGYQAPGSQKTIFLIQDAHTNESGQMNLARALEQILPAEAINTVFTEGAANDASLRFLRDYLPEDALREASDSFVRKGILKGAEYANLNGEHPFTLWGVEDSELYGRALKTYALVMRGRDRAMAYLDRIERSAGVLKEEIYGAELKSLDDAAAEYRAGRLGLTDYFDSLKKSAGPAGVSLLTYPHLEFLNGLKRIESKLDFSKIAREQEAALAALSAADRRELVEASKVKHTPSRLSGEDPSSDRAYYALLEERLALADAKKSFPRLFEYFRYLAESRRMNAQETLNELADFEADVFAGLARSGDEQLLHRLSKNLLTLRNLLEMRLTPRDFDQYRSDAAEFDVNLIGGFFNRKIHELDRHYDYAVLSEKEYLKVFQAAVKFYELAQKRDEAFLANIVARMDAESASKAVLVTGGYHTPNLTRLFKERGISYVTILPQILHPTDTQRYERMVSRQYAAAQKSLRLASKSGDHSRAMADTFMLEDTRSAYLPELVTAGARLAYGSDTNKIDRTVELALAGSRLSEDTGGQDEVRGAVPRLLDAIFKRAIRARVARISLVPGKIISELSDENEETVEISDRLFSPLIMRMRILADSEIAPNSLKNEFTIEIPTAEGNVRALVLVENERKEIEFSETPPLNLPKFIYRPVSAAVLFKYPDQQSGARLSVEIKARKDKHVLVGDLAIVTLLNVVRDPEDEFRKLYLVRVAKPDGFEVRAIRSGERSNIGSGVSVSVNNDDPQDLQFKITSENPVSARFLEEENRSRNSEQKQLIFIRDMAIQNPFRSIDDAIRSGNTAGAIRILAEDGRFFSYKEIKNYLRHIARVQKDGTRYFLADNGSISAYTRFFKIILAPNAELTILKNDPIDSGVTILNFGRLRRSGAPLSTAKQLFHIWNLATRIAQFEDDNSGRRNRAIELDSDGKLVLPNPLLVRALRRLGRDSNIRFLVRTDGARLAELSDARVLSLARREIKEYKRRLLNEARWEADLRTPGLNSVPGEDVRDERNVWDAPGTRNFRTRLQQKALELTDRMGLYRLSPIQRREFVNEVFDEKHFPDVYAAVNRFPDELLRGNGFRTKREAIYRLINDRSEAAAHLSITDDRNLQTAENIILDINNRHREILEQRHILDQFDAELSHLGSGEVPHVAALQDIHGGSRRLLALIGHVLGLPDDVNGRSIYDRIHNLDELKTELDERGIDIKEAPIRIAGVNDLEDRGDDPRGVFKIVQWLHESGKLKHFAGNHDEWRTYGVLRFHHLMERIYHFNYNGPLQKNHHIGSWADEGFGHTGWGDIELDQLNEERFNRAVEAANQFLEKNGQPPLEPIDLAAQRKKFDAELKGKKKANEVLRKAGRLDEIIELPDIFGEVITKVRETQDEYEAVLHAIDPNYIFDFKEVNLENYWEDPEVVGQALWQLRNLELYYIDIYGNLHLHNILGLDHRGFNIDYKGLHGIPALRAIADDIRNFFAEVTVDQLIEGLKDPKLGFTQKIWKELEPAFLAINRQYSDRYQEAKPAALETYFDEGGFERYRLDRQIREQDFVGRSPHFLTFVGHNPRSKVKGPWIHLSPFSGTGTVQVDEDLSQGYQNRGGIVTIGMRVGGKVTGLVRWSYREGHSTKLEDMTFEDIEGLDPLQKRLLEVLHDGKGFMRYYRYRILERIFGDVNLLKDRTARSDRQDKDPLLQSLEADEADLRVLETRRLNEVRLTGLIDELPSEDAQSIHRNRIFDLILLGSPGSVEAARKYFDRHVEELNSDDISLLNRYLEEGQRYVEQKTAVDGARLVLNLSRKVNESLYIGSVELKVVQIKSKTNVLVNVGALHGRAGDHWITDRSPLRLNIDGQPVTIRLNLQRTSKSKVGLEIEAPDSIRVWRNEILEAGGETSGGRLAAVREESARGIHVVRVNQVNEEERDFLRAFAFHLVRQNRTRGPLLVPYLLKRGLALFEAYQMQDDDQLVLRIGDSEWRWSNSKTADWIRGLEGAKHSAEAEQAAASAQEFEKDLEKGLDVIRHSSVLETHVRVPRISSLFEGRWKRGERSLQARLLVETMLRAAKTSEVSGRRMVFYLSPDDDDEVLRDLVRNAVASNARYLTFEAPPADRLVTHLYVSRTDDEAELLKHSIRTGDVNLRLSTLKPGQTALLMGVLSLGLTAVEGTVSNPAADPSVLRREYADARNISAEAHERIAAALDPSISRDALLDKLQGRAAFTIHQTVKNLFISAGEMVRQTHWMIQAVESKA